MPKLVVLSEGLTGRSHELTAEKTTVGRVDDNDFVVTEASVSSHHCEVYFKDGAVSIKDLGSTNGTYVQGEKVTEAKLKAGEVFRLGQVQIRLESGEVTPDKKKLDKTMAITQGVKLNDLEQGGRTVTSPFAKKKDKAKMVFIAVSALLGLVIIGILVFAFMKAGEQ